MKRITELLNDPHKQTELYSLGQAGFIIKNRSGFTIAIDPYLSDYTEKTEGNMGFKRLLPKILEPGDFEFDIVITTHAHSDHFDFDSVHAYMDGNKTELFASVECSELISRLGVSCNRVKYVKADDRYERHGFEITFVDCDHGDAAPDAVGVVVRTDGKTIWETGDTCLRLDFADKIQFEFSDIDVLIGPINGAYGNMNEEEFARLISVVKPGLAIPCHYGMFAAHGGDPGLFYKIMKERYPSQAICLMTQGERIIL